MEQRFEQEDRFYDDNRVEIIEKYKGKMIAIKGDQVLGVVDDGDEYQELINVGDVCVRYVFPTEPFHTSGEFIEVNKWQPRPPPSCVWNSDEAKG